MSFPPDPVWSPRRRNRSRWALAALGVTVLVVACEDPAGNDPNVPDDGIAAPGSTPVAPAPVCPTDLPRCPAAPPSYANDIAPLLKRTCEPCHASGGVAADRNLTTYANVYRIRTTVLTQVYGCRMPPPDAGADSGPSGPLEGADRRLLLQWLECRSPDN